MAMALLCLAGLFLAVYLYLFKIGMIGTLACGTGGCETVQLSPQSRFLGVEVSLIGVIGYAVMLVLAFLALQPRHAGPVGTLHAPGPVVGRRGAVFRLSPGLELFVIHAICRWCVGSAVIILAIFLLALYDRRGRAPGQT
jgi:uncharacterized membrane protein